jgi:hypothetical protein
MALESTPYWRGGRFIWAAIPYLVLRDYREGLSIGTSPIGGRVNFAHCGTFRSLGGRIGEFRVSARADYRRLYDVDFEVLQNPSIPLSGSQAYLPHWPTPGIIPRKRSRVGAHAVAYAGRMENLAEELRNGFDVSDMQLQIIPEDRWHDMAEIDILIAVRSFDGNTHENKPPSKLFNAWLADIPLIAGWDSALSWIGNPGIDYIRVASRKNCAEEIERLASDPAYYSRVQEAGRSRAKDVTYEAIARTWLNCFDDVIFPSFERQAEEGNVGIRRPFSSLMDVSSGLRRGARRAMRRVFRQSGH